MMKSKSESADKSFRIASIQMVSTTSVEANLKTAKKLIKTAIGHGAEMVVLPEYFAIFAKDSAQRERAVEVHTKGRVYRFLSNQAKENKIWIIGGSHPVVTNSQSFETKPFGRCYIFNPDGRYVCHYDKIHLFDVQVEDSHKRYVESEYTAQGNEVCCFDSPWGKIGVAICYDIRFPELFRKLSEKGVRIFIVPAAFTKVTGQAHWFPLLKARAIENLCYTVAAAQGGLHENGRETFGHSCIISPWGAIVADKEQGDGVVVADLDLTHLQQLRHDFPALTHRRL
ncbi:carbon-nitrogen hydrolase family protein [Aliikangiella sp. G2MR2-5]|uniref:carbon-nitrogen hydrolase family protein n=1 Tax=Aliikangiella sp. G2MR2-5 TaxID=2788943 RepID=UPI0018AB1834|nr:carbon-nitrogen hydrolase family protein [Aliikangiella sp. G2MR2-5]